MQRARSLSVAQPGATGFDILSAYDQWNADLLMTRLTSGVWVLERPSAPDG
jgi:hypothetical protein